MPDEYKIRPTRRLITILEEIKKRELKTETIEKNKALTDDDCGAIIECLRNNANPNAVDSDGRTALFYAVIGEQQLHLGFAYDLLNEESDADVNITDKFGLTPLMLACKLGNTRIAHMLVTRGAEVSTISKHGYTALTFACMNGNNAIVTMLLNTRHEGESINATVKSKDDGDGRYNPLVFAVYECSKENVKAMLDAGAKMDKSPQHLVRAFVLGQDRDKHRMLDNVMEVLIKQFGVNNGTADILRKTRFNDDELIEYLKNKKSVKIENLISALRIYNYLAANTAKHKQLEFPAGSKRFAEILEERIEKMYKSKLGYDEKENNQQQQTKKIRRTNKP